MGVFEITATCGLVVWFALTILRQFPGRVGRTLQSRDPLGILPGWSFFAPHPGRHDWILLIRHRLPDGSISNWQEVVWQHPRTWPRWLFNPSRRVRKALFDMVAVFQQEQPETSHQRQLMLSVPYLVWLNVCQSRSLDYPTSERSQFTVLGFEGSKDEDPHPLVVSEFHSR